MLDVELHEIYWRDEEAQRGLKAMQLATSLAVCRALLKGQRVPRSKLDPYWLERYNR